MAWRERAESMPGPKAPARTPQTPGSVFLQSQQQDTAVGSALSRAKLSPSQRKKVTHSNKLQMIRHSSVAFDLVTATQELHLPHHQR